MPKKFTNQNCIHCLDYFEDLTDDHIFPASWYPDSTPQNMEKWVAPACFACNNRLGEIEEEIYKRIAPTVDSNDIAASGVSEKVIRLYDPSLAKDDRDKGRREANIRKLIPDLTYTDVMPKNLMKNYGPAEDHTGKSLLVHIRSELLNPFTEKLIRGLEFKFRNKLILSDRCISTIHPPRGVDDIAPEIEKLNNILNANGVKVDRGPGFVVRHTVDIYNTSLYHITIWGKIEIWGAVSDKNLEIKYAPGTKIWILNQKKRTI